MNGNQRKFGVEKERKKWEKINNKARRSKFCLVAFQPRVSKFLGVFYT